MGVQIPCGVYTQVQEEKSVWAVAAKSGRSIPAAYDGPRNLDSVLSYTWEQKGGGPSGEFKEEAHAVI